MKGGGTKCVYKVDGISWKVLVILNIIKLLPCKNGSKCIYKIIFSHINAFMYLLVHMIQRYICLMNLAEITSKYSNAKVT